MSDELALAELHEKLEAFKRAANDLNRAWDARYEVAILDYPAFMPSFDEAVLSFQAMHVFVEDGE